MKYLLGKSKNEWAICLNNQKTNAKFSCNTPMALNKLAMMNSRRNQISERCLTVKPAKARGHTAYCALKEPSLTALKVAENATSTGLMLPSKREFMC
jgi:hypothetical protein